MDGEVQFLAPALELSTTPKGDKTGENWGRGQGREIGKALPTSSFFDLES